MGRHDHRQSSLVIRRKGPFPAGIRIRRDRGADPAASTLFVLKLTNHTVDLNHCRGLRMACARMVRDGGDHGSGVRSEEKENEEEDDEDREAGGAGET